MEVIEARMAQAKANLTLPFFPGSMAAGSGAEAIVDGFALCSTTENANVFFLWYSREFVSLWQGTDAVKCTISRTQYIDREGRITGRLHASIPGSFKTKNWKEIRAHRRSLLI
jgi:hypothetical protein